MFIYLMRTLSATDANDIIASVAALPGFTIDARFPVSTDETGHHETNCGRVTGAAAVHACCWHSMAPSAALAVALASVTTPLGRGLPN